jgi:hypothetical protein
MYYPGVAQPHHQYLVATKKEKYHGKKSIICTPRQQQAESGKSTLKMYIDCITAGLL